MFLEALVLLSGTAAAGYGISRLLLYALERRGPVYLMSILEAGVFELVHTRGGRPRVGSRGIEVPAQGLRMTVMIQEEDSALVLLGHAEAPAFVHQRISLRGSFDGWRVEHVPMQTIVQEEVFGDQSRNRPYAEGYVICATDQVVFSLGDESLRFMLKDFLGLFGGAHPDVMKSILDGRMPLIPAKLSWDEEEVSVTWWTHSTGGLRQQDVQIGIGGMLRFFEAVSRAASAPGGIAQLLYTRGLSDDLCATIFGLRVAASLLEDEQELQELRARALALQADRFRVCLLALPWEEVEDASRAMPLMSLYALLEDTFTLAQNARDRGLMLENTYPANFEALGRLINERSPDGSVVGVLERAPRTAHFVLAARGQEFLRGFLCEEFGEHAHRMRPLALAGFYDLAAQDPEWDYSGLLRGTPRELEGVLVASGVRSVVMNLVEHHPEALDDVEVDAVILKAIRVGRIEDARVMRDRLLDFGSPRALIDVRAILDRYRYDLGREREMVFEQLIAVWSARGGDAVGGLTISSGEGGELTMASDVGGLTEVVSREEAASDDGCEEG